jgi:Domain of unknown function (DUF397)
MDVRDWRKASYSGTNGGACVETGSTGQAVMVRDSTDREGPKLAFTPQTWREFTRNIKTSK